MIAISAKFCHDPLVLSIGSPLRGKFLRNRWLSLPLLRVVFVVAVVVVVAGAASHTVLTGPKERAEGALPSTLLRLRR